MRTIFFCDKIGIAGSFYLVGVDVEMTRCNRSTQIGLAAIPDEPPTGLGRSTFPQRGYSTQFPATSPIVVNWALSTSARRLHYPSMRMRLRYALTNFTLVRIISPTEIQVIFSKSSPNHAPTRPRLQFEEVSSHDPAD